jgi:diguanylate cyclase (GGDEF)-like protein
MNRKPTYEDLEQRIRELEEESINDKKVKQALRESEEEAKQLAHENAVIAEIGRIISLTPNLEEVYERFSEETQKLILFDRITVTTINLPGNTYTSNYRFGVEAVEHPTGQAFPLSGTTTELILKRKSGLIIQTDTEREALDLYPDFSNVLRAGVQSKLSVPLISKDQVIGALHIRSRKTNAYSKRDLRLAETIAGQIAGAVANAQLFMERKQVEELLRESEREARRHAQEHELIAEIGRIISSTLNLEAVYERFAEEVKKLIPFERLTINVIDYANSRITTAYVAGTELSHRSRGGVAPLAGTITEEAMRTQKSLLIQGEEIQWKKYFDRFQGLEPGYRAGFRSLLSIPLISGDKVIAAIQYRSTSPNAYSENDVRLAERVGNQIAGAIANAELFAERNRAEETIKEMSWRDLLTELYNRRGFIILSEQLLKNANRERRHVRLTFIDCDGLKLINDNFGHVEGDKALVDTAEILRQTFRKSDVIARLGGDEFAVLSVHDRDSDVFSERIQQNIDRFNAQAFRPYKLAMSWGAAIYNPESPKSLDELMTEADTLMYINKNAKKIKSM